MNIPRKRCSHMNILKMKDISKRIERFVLKNYGSYTNFCEISEIDHSTISRLISGKNTPRSEVLSKMYDSGLNINWVLTGEGSMFAENNRGFELNKKYKKKLSKDNLYKIKYRIESWIFENFDSIESFAKEAELEVDFIESELKRFTSPKPKLIRGINKSGCSVEWIMKGEGSPFTNSPSGLILKTRKGSSSEFPDGEEDEIRVHYYKKIYELVKRAVEEVIKENENAEKKDE